MQIQHIGYRVKGFYKIADLSLKVSQMSEIAQKRYEILLFWEKHGLEVTLEVFKISRRTLYGWKKKFKKALDNKMAIVAMSRAPKNKRRRAWPAEVKNEIKSLRKLHANLAKEK